VTASYRCVARSSAILFDMPAMEFADAILEAVGCEGDPEPDRALATRLT
jgi:hypothetical protein